MSQILRHERKLPWLIPHVTFLISLFSRNSTVLLKGRFLIYGTTSCCGFRYPLNWHFSQLFASGIPFNVKYVRQMSWPVERLWIATHGRGLELSLNGFLYVNVSSYKVRVLNSSLHLMPTLRTLHAWRHNSPAMEYKGKLPKAPINVLMDKLYVLSLAYWFNTCRQYRVPIWW